MASWIACTITRFVGLLSSARRTESMQAENQIKISQSNYDAYFKSLEQIDGDAIASVGAIEMICRLGIIDRTLTKQTRQILLAYLERRALLDEAKNERLTKDKFKIQIQHAFVGLLDLQRVSATNQKDSTSGESLTLSHLGLEGLRLPHGLVFVDLYFNRCNFSNTSMPGCRIDNTVFDTCNFSKADLYRAKFDLIDFDRGSSVRGSNFQECSISGTDFNGVLEINEGQLDRCRYQDINPPLNLPDTVVGEKLLPAGALPYLDRPFTLPPPWQPANENDGESGPRYMTKQEAESFWSSRLWENMIPRHGNGKPVKIIYPDDG